MKNIINTLCIAIVLVALPACCGWKKKCTKVTSKDESVVTIENAVDCISIELVDEKETLNSKF